MRKKAAAKARGASATAEQSSALQPTTSRASRTWAMLIARVYEVDPLACPKCGGTMTVVAFIEPPQGAVIEKILKHCGLWDPASPPPPTADLRVHDPVGDWQSDSAC